MCVRRVCPAFSPHLTPHPHPLLSWQVKISFHFTWKKYVPKLTNHSNLFDSRTKLVLQKWQHFLLKWADQPKLCRSAAPRAQPFILQSNTLIVFLNSLWEWLPDDIQGLQLGHKLELCHLPNELERFYQVRNPWMCVEIELFSGQLKMQKWRLWQAMSPPPDCKVAPRSESPLCSVCFAVHVLVSRCCCLHSNTMMVFYAFSTVHWSCHVQHSGTGGRHWWPVAAVTGK